MVRMLKTKSMQFKSFHWLSHRVIFMSNYTMLYKNGKLTHDFLRQFYFLYFGGVLIKTIIPLTLLGYGMIIANAGLCHSLGSFSIDDGDATNDAL